mgnify:CR=1 FL=1
MTDEGRRRVTRTDGFTDARTASVAVTLTVAAVIAGHCGLDEALELAGRPRQCEAGVADPAGGGFAPVEGGGWILHPRGGRRRRTRLGEIGSHVPGDRLPHERAHLCFVHGHCVQPQSTAST